MCSSGNIRSRLNKYISEEVDTKDVLLMGLAELLGTSILVFLGCMGCVGTLGVVPSHLQIAINFGFTVLIAIQCIGHISHAHINPAISIGAVVLGKKTIQESLIYISAQLLGAVLGYGFLKTLTPSKYLSSGIHNSGNTTTEESFCVTDLHSQVSAVQGLVLESAATAILMFVVCAVWDQRNERNTDSVAIKFGLTITALALAVGPYTGCSMNPARSLAPAIWNNYWSHHWIYWFGPIGGSLFASYVYKIFFNIKCEKMDETIPEVMVLNTMTADDSEKTS